MFCVYWIYIHAHQRLVRNVDIADDQSDYTLDSNRVSLFPLSGKSPAKTMRLLYVGLLFAHRLRRWLINKPTLVKRLVFAEGGGCFDCQISSISVNKHHIWERATGHCATACSHSGVGWQSIYQHTIHVEPMLGWCWPSVEDVGPTSAQHWVNMSCLPGYQHTRHWHNTDPTL